MNRHVKIGRVANILITLCLAVVWPCALLTPRGADAQEMLRLGDENSSAEETADDAVAELEGSKSALSGLRGKIRAEAIGKLLADPKPANAPDLALILKENIDELDVQEKVARALSRVGGAERMSVGKRLLKDLSPYRKAMGIRLVAASGEADAASVLIGAVPDMGDDPEVVHHLCRAFALLGDKAALPWLKTRVGGKDAALARMAMCLSGDYSQFRRALSDFDEISASHEKMMLVWNWAWVNQWKTAGDKARAVKTAERNEEYLDLFRRMAGSCGLEQMRMMVETMKAGRMNVANVMYANLAGWVTASNADSFLPLLDAPSPELCEEVARVLADSQAPGMSSKLDAAILAMAAEDSWFRRAAAMRVSDLLPEPEGRKLLACGLRDKNLFVVQEALMVIQKRHVGGLEADVRAVLEGETWKRQYEVRRLAEIILSQLGGV